MTTESWGEEDFSPEEWAELMEDVRSADEEYERGETVEYGGDTGRSISEEVKAWGREMLAAGKKRAS